MNRRKIEAFIGVNLLRLFIAVTAIFLLIFLYVIFSKGGKPALSKNSHLKKGD